jgi:soluble lytic murein transglycosylase-like protein
MGIAVVGTAIPMAVVRIDQIRTEPSHERTLTLVPASRIDDLAVGRMWQQAEARSEADSLAAVEEEREEMVERNLERHARYKLSRPLAERIVDIALQEDVDPDLAFGLVRAESSFRTAATSPVGAVGLTQLMPATARDVQPGVTRAALRDPETNLRIGFKYLKRLLDKYEGNEDLALLAYNRGPGTVDRELRRGRDPNNGYAAFVRGEADHGHTLYTRR